MRNIVLAGGRRTPFGDFGGSLKDIPLAELGVHAVQGSLTAAGLDARQVDHLTFGNVVPVDHDGHFISRKVALRSGLPTESGALNVNRACGSGTEAIASAARLILSGGSRIGIAAGGENFSRVPYVAPSVRWGVKRGPQTLEDGLDYAYRCPFSRELMGETAENLADIGQCQRADMDAWALLSQRRAKSAHESGFLSRQIRPIEIPDGKARRVFAHDEFPRPDITAEKIASLKPAFRKNGRVTPASSSGVTDGAASLVVADAEALRDAGGQAEARWIDTVVVGVPPEIMGSGPVPAIAALLKKHDLAVADIDYFEINEAFAVVNLHAERELGIPRDRTNLYGGAISIGHPPGATGIRMTITAMHHLADTGARYAVVSMCLGAGQGMATLIENVSQR